MFFAIEVEKNRIFEAVERDGEELPLFSVHLNSQRPVEEFRCAPESACLKFAPCGVCIDGRHCEKKVEGCCNLIDVAVGAADGVNKGLPPERAMGGKGESAARFSERSDCLQTGIKNVGNQSLAKFGINAYRIPALGRSVQIAR